MKIQILTVLHEERKILGHLGVRGASGSSAGFLGQQYGQIQGNEEVGDHNLENLFVLRGDNLRDQGLQSYPIHGDQQR